MILDDILARTRADLGARKAVTPLGRFEAAVRDLPAARSLRAALRQSDGITAIAEFKRRSPSAGWIRQDAEIARIVPSYVEAGAAALSVLTDGPFFGGSGDDLTAARLTLDRLGAPVSTTSTTTATATATAAKTTTTAASPGPLPALLRKDFVVDEFQIAEARALGADAVLLIVAALDDATLRHLFAACYRWGVEALVETHDAAEAERAVALGAEIIGVNHRDLRTFTMDMDLAVRLRPLIPSTCVMVAESGIRTAADVRRLAEAQIDAVLVGEGLMRRPDPGAGLRELLGPPGS